MNQGFESLPLRQLALKTNYWEFLSYRSGISADSNKNSDKHHARERGRPQGIGPMLPRLNRPPHCQASTASRPIDARLLLIDRLQI